MLRFQTQHRRASLSLLGLSPFQVLANKKCPAGKNHYADGNLVEIRQAKYQQEVRTSVAERRSNCGVPLHANNYVVLDIDCVKVEGNGQRVVDTLLIENIKKMLSPQQHTYCVVSIKLARARARVCVCVCACVGFCVCAPL